MGESFGQWFFFMYLCTQEKRAVSLSIVRQNGSHKSVKKLLHFCYTTTWTNQLGSCYTTKYERVVLFPLSPQIAVAHWAMAIFFIMIGTCSFVSILYFEIREAFYISLLATCWLHSSQKTVFPQTWFWEQRKITSCSFFSFLIYTFVGAHFNGHRRACCSHRLYSGDVETLPNNKYH